MEKSIVLILFLLFNLLSWAQKEQPREFEMTEGDTTYVMKQYIFCLYLSGSERSQSEEETARLQEAHMNHMNSMAEEHGLLVAGPFGDDTEKRGILVFDVESVEAAVSIIQKDPMVISKRLAFECHPWWTAKDVCLD